jgi:hypothetical protein
MDDRPEKKGDADRERNGDGAHSENRRNEKAPGNREQERVQQIENDLDEGHPGNAAHHDGDGEERHEREQTEQAIDAGGKEFAEDDVPTFEIGEEEEAQGVFAFFFRDGVGGSDGAGEDVGIWRVMKPKNASTTRPMPAVIQRHAYVRGWREASRTSRAATGSNGIFWLLDPREAVLLRQRSEQSKDAAFAGA